jgi:hypothetical protein
VRNFDVSDDDMSDSLLPPIAGLDPDAGDDLDGMLSGDGQYLPDGQLQVARTLGALCGVPLSAELAGEDAARAAFRMIMARGPNATVPLAAVADDWTTAPEVPADTVRADTAGGGAGRHRRPRPSRRFPLRDAGWPAKALAAAAAVVVIAGGAALASTVAGSGGHNTAASSGPTQQATSVASAPGTSDVEGTGSTARIPASPTATATATQPAQGPSPQQLCDEYLPFYLNPRQQPTVAQQADFNELQKLAQASGGVWSYCTQVRQTWMQPGANGNSHGLPAYSVNSRQEPQGEQGSNQSAGHGGAKDFGFNNQN